MTSGSITERKAVHESRLRNWTTWNRRMVVSLMCGVVLLDTARAIRDGSVGCARRRRPTPRLGSSECPAVELHEHVGQVVRDRLLDVEKAHDVAGQYGSPPEKTIVLSTGEKSRIHALDRAQSLLPMAPRQAERRPPDYVRRGTASLFAALGVATGQVTGMCYWRLRAREFLKFLNEIDAQIAREPGGETRIVLDNDSTHKAVVRPVCLDRRSWTGWSGFVRVSHSGC
jgi:hypothetical protein